MAEHFPDDDSDTFGAELHAPDTRPIDAADIGRAALVASGEFSNTFGHPELTAEQERRIFELIHDEVAGGAKLYEVPAQILYTDAKLSRLIETQSDPNARQWWRQAFANYGTASDIVIACYQRALLPIVNRYKDPFIPFEDRIAGANEGLLRALERYDVEKGNRFLTMAIPWAIKGVQTEIARQYGITPTVLAAINTARVFAYGFRQLHRDKLPTDEELRTLLTAYADGKEGRPIVSIPMINEALAFIRMNTGERELGEQSQATQPASELLPSGTSESINAAPISDDITQAITQLTSRQQLLIAAQFGLGEHGFADALGELEITEAQAQSELAMALTKLRNILTIDESGTTAVTHDPKTEILEAVITPEVQAMLVDPQVKKRDKVILLVKQQRFNNAEIGKILGITREAVRQVIKAAGKEVEGYLSPLEVRTRIVEESLRNQKTMAESARNAGVSLGMVRKIAHRLHEEEGFVVTRTLSQRPKVEETPDMLLFKQWLTENKSQSAMRYR